MSLYSRILERTALPMLLLRENRHSALQHLRQLNLSQFWSSQELLRYQSDTLRSLLDHAYRTCPYYNRVMKERNLQPGDFRQIGDLARLPILTKDLVLENMDDILSTDYDRSDLMKFSSGGTTGQQTTMLVDRNSVNAKMASAWRFESWFGMTPCDKQVVLWPATMDLEESPPLRTRLKNRFLWRNLVLNVGGSSDERMMHFYREIKEFSPSFIKAFPNSLIQLLDFMEDRSLRLPRLEAVESTGEPLYDELKERIESVLGCPVFDMYGSREVGHTASQCEVREGLHIAMETQIVEFLHDGEPAPDGEPGELFITDLTNFGFPLIRFEMNDYGHLIKEPCPCGRGLHRMSAGIGRVSDDLIGLDGQRHSAHVLGIHLTADLDHRIGQMQIVQREVADFLVRITNRPAPSDETYRFIEKTMKSIIGDRISIEFEIVERIPREPSGKTRYFICQV